MVTKPLNAKIRQRLRFTLDGLRSYTQSFAFHSHIMHDYVAKTFLYVSSSEQSNDKCVLCTVKAKRANKNIQRRILSGFIAISFCQLICPEICLLAFLVKNFMGYFV